jgi:tyrosinase
MAMSDSELPDTVSPSRHQRFRAIMDAAAGASTAGYLNHPRFWNMPLPELRNFRLYGIAMMRTDGPSAPAPETCCYAADTHTEAAAPPSATGAGLVRGLRGQFPFDGSQFPPLPWGGRRLTKRISFS